MHGEGHHPRVLGAFRVEAVELVLDPLQPFGRGVVLDHHHGNVVELDRVRHGDETARGGADLVGLIVVDPVGDVLDALGGQMVERLPCLREARPEPALGLPARELRQHLDRLADGRALIGQDMHGALDHAMGHELPSRLEHGPRHGLVGLDNMSVDGGGRAQLPLGERLEKPPEAHAHAVVVPGPVRHVGHGAHALGSGQILAGHRLLDVPLLDVDDGPHGDAGALGQLPHGTARHRRVVEAFAWQLHSLLLRGRGLGRATVPLGFGAAHM